MKNLKSFKTFFENLDYWGSKLQPLWRPGTNPVVDILVVRENKEILLIKRSNESDACPGMWALPGGFHDTYAGKGEPWKLGKETAKDAALRELQEETGLNIESEELIEVGVYDNIDRDPRNNEESWISSTLFTCQIKDINQQVKGGDDASKAKWFPIEEVLNMKLAFDHSILVKDGLKLLF